VILVTEKLINIAIFWLPLFAGIILGGLSPSVWYGGDKIAALWMTFFGLVLLLLTGTFQVQAYIQSTVLQPQIQLFPQQKSVLTWNPPTDNSLNIKGENDQLPPGNWKVPVFTIKNITPINAQDVKITWSAAKYDPATIAASAPVFQGRQISVANNVITLSGGGVPHQNPIGFSAAIDKPFITRSAETFIPLDVWNTAAVFFLANLPDQPGSRSEPYYFDLEISWSIPENAKPARFRVMAVATNAKPAGAASPAFSALVEFSVESQ
jgi:hypothetical protein